VINLKYLLESELSTSLRLKLYIFVITFITLNHAQLEANIVNLITGAIVI